MTCSKFILGTILALTERNFPSFRLAGLNAEFLPCLLMDLLAALLLSLYRLDDQFLGCAYNSNSMNDYTVKSVPTPH